MKKATDGRKIRTVFGVMICALILVMSAFALFGCKKPVTELTTSGLSNWQKVVDRNALYVEWQGEYKSNRPTLVVFHGETEKDKVSFNIPVNVYEGAVNYDEQVNENTIGWRAFGLKKTADGSEYDLLSGWTNAAKYNVVVVHAEKFFRESTEDVLTKLYSSYKSRFIDGGETIDCDFNVSFATVIAVYLDECFKEKNVSGEEIRYVGYGAGANAALAVAYATFSRQETGNVRWNGNGFYPSRITLCDPCISGTEFTFTPRLTGMENAKSASSIVAETASYINENTPAVVELVESAERNGKTATYAYTDNVRSGTSYEKLLSSSASLTLAESYSLSDAFASYKNEKRLAFDWYVYSVIGSDDSFTRSSEDQTNPVGYPNAYFDYINNNASGKYNWDDNARRPMLNDRAHTNDGDAERGCDFGLNFSLSAWTPTAYMKGLVGVSFLQKKATGKTGERDVHGNATYAYEEYVLPSFRSENYQVSSRTEETVVTGRIYVDENGDGKMNDGLTSAMTSSFYLTVETNDGTVLCDRAVVYTDVYGCYAITIQDKRDGDNGISRRISTGAVTITGFAASEGSLILRFELYCPKGYSAKNFAASALWYDGTQMNNFDRLKKVMDISQMNAHSVIVCNALFAREE